MRSKFDQQLALLNEELTQMGETCAKAICLAAQALERLGKFIRQGFKCHGIYPFRS